MVLILILFSLLNPKIEEFTIIEGRAQGTSYLIKYIQRGRKIDKRSIDSIFHVIDASVSLYDSNSLISRFNRSGRILMDSHMKRVIETSLRVYRESGGSFDITSAAISRAWGFGPGGSKHMPARKEIRKALKITGSDLLLIGGDSLFAAKNGVQIDCNGIAQGYTVDVIVSFLSSQGIDQMLVELGGEIAVKGEHPETGYWKIGVESVEAERGLSRPVERIIQVRNKAITTSGNYRNYFTKGSKMYSHVVDPSSGRPVDNGIIAVTVVANTAMEADAWDNAFFVMGLDKTSKYLNQHKELEVYIIYKDKNGIINEYLSH